MQSQADVARHAELEAEANRLLREQPARYESLEYPFYATSSLRQVSRKDERVSLREMPGPAGEASVAGRLLDRLDVQVELSDVNRVLLGMVRSGLGVDEIADRLGLTGKAVCRRMERIVARLRRAGVAAGGYEPLAREAFAEETRPHRYTPEHHCNEGSEACRRDGRCKYRWYLYALNAQTEAE